MVLVFWAIAEGLGMDKGAFAEHIEFNRDAESVSIKLG